MAPANGGANPRKGSASKPRPKSVIPAIPLTYMPRRAQNRASATTQPPPQASQTNGDTQATPKGAAAEPAKAEPAPTPTTNGTAKVEEDHTQAAASEDSPTQVSPVAVEPPSQAPSVPSTNSTADDSGLDSTANGTPALDSPKSAPAEEMNPHTGGPKIYAPPPSNALPRSMPPPFHPSANGPNMMYGGDMSLGPRPPHHQPHPSNSSLHFGAFHDSNSSSPAPHSGGYAPPPGLPLPNGRPSHMGRPSGPDFRPQSMMFGNDFEPTSVDPYGQSMASYSPHDGGYPPYMGNYLPSTPHSFHDSQSSGHPDEMYSQFSQHGATNGSHNHNHNHQVDGGRAQASGPMMSMHHPPPGMMPPMPPPHVVHRILEPDPDQFFSHFKDNFQDPRFADCTLELRFPDNRAPPLRIPAHRLVLSRSSFLEQLMVGDHNTRRRGSNANTVSITADDRYLRPDAFVTALQRLYAFPLFSIPTPPPGSEDLPLAGGAIDRFSFVVSYAAAGHLLQCVSVVLRGMEMATQLLCWETLEPALEFAVGASQARGTIDIHERYPYGDPTRILLEGIVGFVASRITTDFMLDPSVPDPQGYSRLPSVPESPKRSASSKRPPAIARGTSVHMTQGRRSRLTNIKFGDMSVEGSAAVDGPNGTGPAKPAQNHTSPQIAALSRVLLNLPFGCLKAILESSRFGLDAESPEANAEARQRVAVEVISERESRRLVAVEAVTTGRVPSPDGARRVLSSVEPRAADDWGVLGFQESVVPISNAHSPHISRAWIPLAGGDDDRSPSGVGWSGPAYP